MESGLSSLCISNLNMQRIIFHRIITMVLFVGCVSADIQAADTQRANAQLYRNSTHGFELTWPGTWEINSLAQGPVFAIKNKDNSRFGVFSVSVGSVQTDSDKLMAQLEKDSGKSVLRSVKSRFGDAELIGFEKTRVSGFPAFMTTISYEVNNLDFRMKITAIQVVCIHVQKIYLFNFESPDFSFEENYRTFKTIMSSFNFR